MTDGPTPTGGFPCPQCGAVTTVYGGRRVSPTMYRRWRLCGACDHRFRTSERPATTAPNTTPPANTVTGR